MGCRTRTRRGGAPSASTVVPNFLPNIQISAGTSNGGDAGTFNYGDYTGLTFFGSSLFPAWADNSNSTGDNPDGALSRMDTYTSRATLQWTGGEIVNM